MVLLAAYAKPALKVHIVQEIPMYRRVSPMPTTLAPIHRLPMTAHASKAGTAKIMLHVLHALPIATVQAMVCLQAVVLIQLVWLEALPRITACVALAILALMEAHVQAVVLACTSHLMALPVV